MKLCYDLGALTFKLVSQIYINVVCRYRKEDNLYVD